MSKQENTINSNYTHPTAFELMKKRILEEIGTCEKYSTTYAFLKYRLGFMFRPNGIYIDSKTVRNLHLLIEAVSHIEFDLTNEYCDEESKCLMRKMLKDISVPVEELVEQYYQLRQYSHICPKQE